MSPETVALGQRVFRFETFGDEQFWTDKLKLHEVVAQGGESEDGAVRRPQGGCRSDSAGRRAGHQGRQGQPRQPRHHGDAAQAQRSRRSQGHGAVGRRQGHARRARHHLRALPLDRRRFVHEGHRQAPRWLAESGPQPGRDHRALARHHRRPESRVLVVGSGQVRSAHEPRQEEHAARLAAGLRPRVGEERNVHGRRSDVVLERVRRGDADGR